MSRPSAKLAELVERARTSRDASSLVEALLHHDEPSDDAYATAARALLAAVEGEAPRLALTLAWYLEDPIAERRCLERVPVGDRARTLERWSRADGGDPGLLRRAAALHQEDGRLVRAALCLERLGEPAAAAALWARLGADLSASGGDAYAAGLAWFDLARMRSRLSDPDGVHEAAARAVRELEPAADRFESVGQRERAYDCWQVVLELGKLTGEFEHVIEGAVNAIRILREDRLVSHALRLWHHALELAERAEEPAAAAHLARELVAYARRNAMPELAAHTALREAAAWQSVAERARRRGGGPDAVEDALTAALTCLASVGRYSRVVELRRQLAELPLDPWRKARHLAAAERLRSVADEPLPRRPEELGAFEAGAEVWLEDLVEWEARGSAAEVCADVLLVGAAGGDAAVRRAALVGRLCALVTEAAAPHERARAEAQLARHLGPIQLYVVLAPLERLAASVDESVRAAAVDAVGHHYFKRSFVTVERALGDPSRLVADAGLRALDRLRFDHAIEPLARIHRMATAPAVRLATLRALARLDTPEAAELGVATLSEGSAEERRAVLAELRSAPRRRHWVEPLREAAASSDGEAAAPIGALLREWGVT
ncbi:MAG: HEAT repeat domain-containing protein [Polyangiaceae bacterium]|nr:HEAT repeat domain-containing protein [Polyangiaceae bacterium]